MADTDSNQRFFFQRKGKECKEKEFTMSAASGERMFTMILFFFHSIFNT